MSFNFLGTFRKGSYLAFRKFVVNELRSVKPRIRVIETELARIGKVAISWQKSETDPTKCTERRIGFYVQPHTSLGKLLQVYVAMGGNPFDISMFLEPEDGLRYETGEEGTLMYEEQPSGGIAYLRSRVPKTEAIANTTDEGGEISLAKNIRMRIGQTNMKPYGVEIATKMKHARKWCSKEIRYKRNDIEWKIIKLCDLVEQLEQEKDWLVKQAVGNVLEGYSISQNNQFAVDLTVQAIFDYLDSVVCSVDEYGWPDLDQFNEEQTKRSVFPTIYDDIDEEKWTAL